MAGLTEKRADELEPGDRLTHEGETKRVLEVEQAVRVTWSDGTWHFFAPGLRLVVTPRGPLTLKEKLQGITETYRKVVPVHTLRQLLEEEEERGQG